MEAREKQLDLINNTDAMEKLQQKIDEKLAAMARGENIEDHEYEDWHQDLMAQKKEEEEALALKEQKERDEAERKYLEEAEAERLREEAELKALWEKQQEDHQNLDIASKEELNRRFQEQEFLKNRPQGT